MDEHLTIFDDLYDIKDNITDGNFLILNNKLKNLVQENKNLKEFIRKNVEEFEFELELEEDSECSCSTRYVFPNSINSRDDISEFFCLSSKQRMLNCENFKKILEKLPLLENLFRKIDMPFAEEPIYSEYNKKEITLILKILLFFTEEISGKKNKSIITFVIFDYMIKNINFLKNEQIISTTLLNKLEELLTDAYYLLILSEYNINYSKWIDIFTIE